MSVPRELEHLNIDLLPLLTILQRVEPGPSLVGRDAAVVRADEEEGRGFDGVGVAEGTDVVVAGEVGWGDVRGRGGEFVREVALGVTPCEVGGIAERC